MEKNEIIEYRNRFNCGDTVITNSAGEGARELIKAFIWQKYPKFAVLVNTMDNSDGKQYKWCIHWTELMKTNP